MANEDLLREINPADIEIFRKDFTQMIKVGSEIDRYYKNAHSDLDILIPKFENLILKFNKKYSGIKIKTRKNIEQYTVRIFVGEKDIKEFFANSASRIIGLKSVGRTNFNQADIADIEKFTKLLDSVIDEIYLTYTDAESGTGTLAAMLGRKEKMIELINNPAEMINFNSAGFKICAFYALREGFERQIEVYGDALTFGFLNLLNEIEKREWHDRFNPRFMQI